MPFGRRHEEPEYETPEPPDDSVEEMTDYLSDMCGSIGHIETLMNELVNQGDRQVECLQRLVTLFEGAAREAREARNNGATGLHRNSRPVEM